MTRIILPLIGFLTFAILVILVSLTGLFALSGMLEQRVAVKEVNNDIQFLTAWESIKEIKDLSCQNIPFDIKELKQYVLHKEASKVEIKTARQKLFGLGHQIAQCAQEETKTLLTKGDAAATKTALFTFVKGLDIAGRQMDFDFNEEEKNYFKEVKSIQEQQVTKEKVDALTKEALPLYKLTMERLNNQITLFVKK